ncbi:MAG: glycosyltransferase family 4 protein [Chitinophagaceae bacterium]|nr:glycosyltransferase family 4 protein [Chitinophagaceae bacterium]
MSNNRVLISSPSLDVKENVSGISSLVSDIISTSRFQFIHFRLGSKDSEKKNILWFGRQIMVYYKAVYCSLFKQFTIFHLNLGLEKLSIVRDYFIFLIFKKIFRKKMLLHIHGGYYLMNTPSEPFFSYLLKSLFENADAIIVLSSLEKSILTNRYGPRNFHVLPNAVRITKAEPASKPSGKDKRKLIFMGRINKSKGVFVISEAFKYLTDYFGKFSFEIYGAGPETEEFEKCLSHYEGLDFSFRGIVGGDDKWNALRKADVFLLPSLHGEGLPVALLEAMSVGCVVIVTDDASITTVVKNNENGIVIPKNDPLELAFRIIAILDGEINSNLLGFNAQNYISKNLSINNYIHSLEGVYSTLN